MIKCLNCDGTGKLIQLAVSTKAIFILAEHRPSEEVATREVDLPSVQGIGDIS